MALPTLTDADRRRALEKAAEVRTARAKLREDIKSRKLSVGEVLEKADDPVISRLKVSTLIESLPGYGKAKAVKIMSELDISEGRRIKGLGTRQRKALLDRLTD